MANKFTSVKKGSIKIYRVPDVIRQASGVLEIAENGTVYDGKYYNNMYQIKKLEDTEISFEKTYAKLRNKNAKYKITLEKPEMTYYLTLYSDKSNIDEALEHLDELEKLVQRDSMIRLDRMDGDERLKLLHVMCMNERKPALENYFKPGSWLKDIRMLNNIFRKDKSMFQLKEEYCKVYSICTINNGDESSENMYRSLAMLPDVKFITSDFDSIPDEYVVRQMKDKYLDADVIISRNRRKYPELYNAYVNGSDEDTDTRAYTLGGITIMFATNTVDKLQECEYSLLSCSKKENFDVVTLYGHQKEAYASLFSLTARRLSNRIHPTDEAIDFFPAFY